MFLFLFLTIKLLLFSIYILWNIFLKFITLVGTTVLVIESSPGIWNVFRVLDEKEHKNQKVMSSRQNLRHTERLLIPE